MPDICHTLEADHDNPGGWHCSRVDLFAAECAEESLLKRLDWNPPTQADRVYALRSETEEHVSFNTRLRDLFCRREPPTYKLGKLACPECQAVTDP
ncbi:hypothetical protein RRG08_015912 [Elysia crispata]|uniref:Uncharacterized protein n=1 Tax=Elysia crispata TaxID=231223 RepID=A0AAE1AMK4_9GAST|nr:hypothetical protein RRG08_015912 [Elysia crispata]